MWRAWGNLVVVVVVVIVTTTGTGATTQGLAGGGTCEAGVGAGTYIHLLTPRLAPGHVGDAHGCCAACIPPRCATWGFGYGNGTLCWLSSGPPVSTAKRPGFAGGVAKRRPPQPPGPPPPPPQPRCDHPDSPVYPFGCLFGQSQWSDGTPAL